jgi:voltage-gated potassium channel
MLTRLIVYSAYFIKTSLRYRSCKTFFYDLLENPHSKLKSYFDFFMIVLVMLSVFLLIYGVREELGRAEDLFENIVVAIFIIEYLLRAWLYSDSHRIILAEYEKSEYLGTPFRLNQVFLSIAGKKLQYVFSPVAIIDLLAILPSYRPLRVLRVFLIFRLFKLFRYSQSINVFAEVLTNKRFELTTLALFLGFLIFIASTAVYMFENQIRGGEIDNLFDAVYWAVVTLSTVGYGDITPQTTGGRFVTLALIISGLGVISFFTSIIVASFSEKMEGLRENRTYAELEKLAGYVIICGFGRVGQEVASLMHKDKQHFVIIDADDKNVVLAKQLGYLAIRNDASKNEVLQNAGITGNATTVVCTTGNDVTNVYITLTSRHLNPQIRIISRVNRHENYKKMLQAGADDVIHPFEIASLLAAEYIGQPVASEAILGILQEKQHIVMEAVTVAAGSCLENQSIDSIDFKRRKLTLVGVISSNPLHKKFRNRYKVHDRHFFFNPEQNFLLRDHDILVLLGRDYSISHLKDQIEKSRLKSGKKR